jgi:aminoglycoside 2'-N-acetyltransferase I
MTGIVRRTTAEMSSGDLGVLRELFEVAWPADDPDEAFSEEDFEHALGGMHFLIEEDGLPVSHACVVERELHADGHPLRTGYVEAVATAPAFRRRGYATAVMRAVGEHVDRSYELGALGTGLLDFYRRLGWTVWRGPTSVRTAHGLVRTPDEDGFVLVRITPSTPPLDLAGQLSCDWRPGDVW